MGSLVRVMNASGDCAAPPPALTPSVGVSHLRSNTRHRPVAGHSARGEGRPAMTTQPLERRDDRLSLRDWFAAVGRDAHFALRAIRRSSAFAAAAALLTLALSVGATTAVFGVVDAILIRPLPRHRPRPPRLGLRGEPGARHRRESAIGSQLSRLAQGRTVILGPRGIPAGVTHADRRLLTRRPERCRRVSQLTSTC